MNQAIDQTGLQAKYQQLSAMTPKTTEEVDRKVQRYFFYAGDEPGHKGGLSVESLSIPDRVLLRCAVTPCLTTYRFGKHVPTADGVYTDIRNLIPGSQDEGLQEKSGKRRMGYAKEWVYAGEEAQGLLDNYGNPGDSARNWGLVELKALRGMEIEHVYGNLNPDGVFFPTWPEVPETNADVRLQIETVRDLIKADKIPNILKENKQIYLQCAEEMLLAVDAAERFQSNAMRRTNVSITVPSSDPEFKKEADSRDYVFSKRTGIAILMNASRSGGSPVDDVIKGLAETLKGMSTPALDSQALAAIVGAAVAAALKEQDKGPTNGKKAA
jgi:hypothetical protein